MLHCPSDLPRVKCAACFLLALPPCHQHAHWHVHSQCVHLMHHTCMICAFLWSCNPCWWCLVLLGRTAIAVPSSACPRACGFCLLSPDEKFVIKTVNWADRAAFFGFGMVMFTALGLTTDHNDAAASQLCHLFASFYGPTCSLE